MQDFISIITDWILRLAIAGVVLFFSTVVIPWLKEKRLYAYIEKRVWAAEKLKESGQLEDITKLEYVEQGLLAKGYTLTDAVRALIEAAVKALDLKSYGIVWSGSVEPLSSGLEIEIGEAKPDE